MPSGLPNGNVDLSTGKSRNQSWNGNNYVLAEVATNQMENRFLARMTGKQEYANKAMRAFDIVRYLQPSDGLLFEQIKDGGTNGVGGGSFSLFFNGGERKLSFDNSKVRHST